MAKKLEDKNIQLNDMDLILNPIRMRIIVFLSQNESATTQEIGESLSDIPPASLYRHIKKLHESGLIKIVKETKIRGTVRRSYQLDTKKIGQSAVSDSKEDTILFIYSLLMSIFANFQAYLEKEDSHMKKDGYVAHTTNWYMTKEELQMWVKRFQDLMQEMVKSTDPSPSEDKLLIQTSFFANPIIDKKQKSKPPKIN